MLVLSPERWCEVRHLVPGNFAAIDARHALRTRCGQLWAWPERHPWSAALIPPGGDFFHLFLGAGAPSAEMPETRLAGWFRDRWGILHTSPGQQTILSDRFGLSFSDYSIQTLAPGTSPMRTGTAVGVRMLSPADGEALEGTLPGWMWGLHTSLEDFLGNSTVVGAPFQDRIVSVAAVTAETDDMANIGVWTARPQRGRGLAAHCAADVIRHAHRRGQTAIWITNHDNRASLAVARRLGFRLWDNRRLSLPTSQAPDARPHHRDG